MKAEAGVESGLSEVKDIEKQGVDHDRHGPNQVPKKSKSKASKNGKKFTIC